MSLNTTQYNVESVSALQAKIKELEKALNLAMHKNNVLLQKQNASEQSERDPDRVGADAALKDQWRENFELRKGTEKYFNLLKSLPDRVFALNLEGKITTYFDNLPESLQSQKAGLEGLNINDAYSPELGLLYVEQVQMCLENEKVGLFEYSEGDGLFERWFEARSSKLNDSEVAFLVRDITQSRREVQHLKKAKEKAEANDHFKSAFLANISHEIKTPLNAINGFSLLLADEDLSKEEKNNFLGIIERNSEQLTNLFSDLLDISKIESGQLKIAKENVRVNEEIDKLLQQFEQSRISINRSEVSLVLEAPLNSDEAIVLADETRFVQVFTNLLSNALKFTEKGEIVFGYRLPSRGKIQFFVKDTGAGIPKDEQDSIFDRYRQSSTNNLKKHGGTGLGLAISKNLVEMMGGRIWLTSSQGKGTTFNFTLPYMPLT